MAKKSEHYQAKRDDIDPAASFGSAPGFPPSGKCLDSTSGKYLVPFKVWFSTVLNSVMLKSDKNL